jgi:ketosteroid isomerase-like protein
LFDRLLPSLQTVAAPPGFTVSEIIVEKDRGVVLASSNGEGQYGPYVQPHYAFVIRVAGDGFAEVVEFNDTVAIEKALYGRQFAKT